jgi:hypothetical protein
MKDGKKVNGNDLKCDKCGKGYKHSSCLSKHLFVPTFLFRASRCYVISNSRAIDKRVVLRTIFVNF